MPLSVIPSFLYYCFISGITPGPANLTSLATSARKGRKAALSQWRGILAGFSVVAVASVFVVYFMGGALGDKAVYLSVVGALYLVFLGVKILLDRKDTDGEKENRPKRGVVEGTFLYGFLVQMTNVKIMLFCVSALSGYVLPYSRDFLTLFLYGLSLILSGPVCNLAWVFLGGTLTSFFRRHALLADIIMALSLFICALTMVWQLMPWAD